MVSELSSPNGEKKNTKVNTRITFGFGRITIIDSWSEEPKIRFHEVTLVLRLIISTCYIHVVHPTCRLQLDDLLLNIHANCYDSVNHPSLILCVQPRLPDGLSDGSKPDNTKEAPCI